MPLEFVLAELDAELELDWAFAAIAKMQPYGSRREYNMLEY
jgi:hypothetical protein